MLQEARRETINGRRATRWEHLGEFHQTLWVATGSRGCTGACRLTSRSSYTAFAGHWFYFDDESGAVTVLRDRSCF